MMKNFEEMSIKELCELAHGHKVEIEVRIEPNEQGQTRTITIQPWEKYEPRCPYGQQSNHEEDTQKKGLVKCVECKHGTRLKSFRVVCCDLDNQYHGEDDTCQNGGRDGIRNVE